MALNGRNVFGEILLVSDCLQSVLSFNYNLQPLYDCVCLYTYFFLGNYYRSASQNLVLAVNALVSLGKWKKCFGFHCLLTSS